MADPGGPAGAAVEGRPGDSPSGDATAADATPVGTSVKDLTFGGGPFGLISGNAGDDRGAEDLETAEDAAGRTRLKKAPNAFRTISEVADDLHIPQHVLRFWETKFHQVKPMKRGGGRRYYRPDDIALLRRISDLLYIQGYTIKGVQRLLREGGGHLSDDIPPAPADERAAAEAEHDGMHPQSSDPLIPGLDLTSPGQPSEAAPVARSGTRRRPPDPEVERLRAALVEALAELEAIRAMLR